MRICAAQTRPLRGEVQSNIERHVKFIDLAVSKGADTVIFPELSVTGYEPELAKELAIDEDDSRLDVFQKLADARRITIGVGLPTKNGAGVSISMLIFQPGKPRQTYSKKYLHSDEEEFFVRGQSSVSSIGERPRMALAICYELSVPQHSEDAHRSGAEIYLASVAKTAAGVDRAFKSLSEIASRYSMTALMSNCVGPCAGFESAGRSAVWDSRGQLLGRLDDTSEGVLIFDTETQEVLAQTIED